MKTYFSLLFIAVLLFSGVGLSQDLEPYTIGTGNSIEQGQTLTLTSVTWNFHSGAAPSSVLKYYLSTTPDLSGTHRLLATDILDPIPGTNYTEGALIPWAVPVNFTPGHYYILAIVDPDNVITETNETNNMLARPFEIKSANPRTYLIENTTVYSNYPYLRSVKSSRTHGFGCSNSTTNTFQSSVDLVGHEEGAVWCTTVVNYMATVYFPLPAGLTMRDVANMTVKFQHKSYGSPSPNRAKVKVMSHRCSGNATDFVNCIKGGTDIGVVTMADANTPSGFGDYEITISPTAFPESSTGFSLGFVADQDQRKTALRLFKCEIEYKTDDFGCSQVQWWKDDVNASNNNIVKDNMHVDDFGNAIFRTTSDRIGFAVGDAFGYHNLWEIGPNLNYSVASNIASKPGGGQYYYQSSDNSLHALYLSGSTWVDGDFGGITGNSCAGSVVTNSNGQIFYRTTSGGINCVFWNGSSWLWSPLNNAVTSGCAGDLVINNNDQIFYRTTSGGIKYLYWTGSNWAVSNADNAVTSGCAGNLAINSNDQVFFKTTAGGMYCLYWAGTQWAAGGLGNIRTSGIDGDITMGADDKVYYVETGGEINYIHWTGSGWENAELTAGIGINSITAEGGIASGDLNFNSGYYIEPGNELRRFYYGSAIGCDPSRSAVAGPGDPLADSEGVESFGSPLPIAPAVPMDLSTEDEQADIAAQPIVATMGDGRYRIMLNGYVPESSYIMDMHGKAIVGKHQQVGQESIEVDLSSLASGVYMMHLIGSNGRQPQAIKFVR